ncbi:MAG: glycosyltransferase family 2 protein [Parvularculaceae bacterium]|nr:glycosyltransferase family 2 protein [Parvularculaceae bacterium]
MSVAPVVAPRAEEKPRLLSIVCPAYNEAEGLLAFHRAVRKAMAEIDQPFEVVFVNDGSTDATLQLMGELRARHPATTIVDLSRNFGKEIALTAGLDAARGDAVVVIDADLQDPPSLIGEMIAGWREGYDVVYAQRRAREGESWLKLVSAGLFYRLMRGVGEVGLPENVGDFRLMSRKAVDAVCTLRERHRFMKGLFAWVGFPSKVIQYDRAPREAGATKWNYWKLWNLSIEGITSSTLAPLKVSTYLGFATAAAAFALGIFFVVKKLFFGDPVQGFSALIVAMLFLGGVQLAVLGVMGEYLGRIFNETKKRPLYFVNAILPSKDVACDTAAPIRDERRAG